MTVPYDTIAAVRQFQVLPSSNEGVGLDHQNLGQHPPSTFTGDFSQRIVNRIRLAEWDNRGIAWRIAFGKVLAGFDTRLDTPPSFNCRHPDSRLAYGGIAMGSSSIPGCPRRTAGSMHNFLMEWLLLIAAGKQPPAAHIQKIVLRTQFFRSMLVRQHAGHRRGPASRRRRYDQRQ